MNDQCTTLQYMAAEDEIERGTRRLQGEVHVPGLQATNGDGRWKEAKRE
jgi:hypothetical protein